MDVLACMCVYVHTVCTYVCVSGGSRGEHGGTCPPPIFIIMSYNFYQSLNCKANSVVFHSGIYTFMQIE